MLKRIGITFILALMILSGSSVNALDNTLTVGMECNSAPFNWTQTTPNEFTEPLADGQSYCDGYDVQIARMIAKELNMKLEVKNYAVFSSLVDAAKLGDIDLIIAGMTDTAERRESITFTDVYYKIDAVIVVPKDSELAKATTLSDFSGHHISAQLGGTQDTLIDQIPDVNHGMPMESIPVLTTALKGKAIDGFVTEKPIATTIQNSNPDLTYIAFEPNMGFEMTPEDSTVSIGLAKENVELKESVNRILNQLTDKDRERMMEEAIERQPSSETSENAVLMPQGFFPGIIFLLQNYAPLFLKGLATTLIIAVCGTGFGLVIGLFVTGLRQIKITKRDNGFKRIIKRVIRAVATGYVQYLRGTPMMVQGILFYYGIRGLGINLSPTISGIIVVSINTSAYMSEGIRAGIQAIDPGQYEAARSIGMSEWQTMLYIILPQGLRNAIPALGNELVANIKDSSVLNVIMVSELFFQANRVSGIYYRQMEAFFIVSLIYLTLTLISSKLLAMIEKHLDNPKGERNV